MKIQGHISISSAAGAGLYIATKSPVAAAAAVFSGIFIDLDHLIDYFAHAGFRLDIVDFFRTCEKCELKKIAKKQIIRYLVRGFFCHNQK